MADKRADPLPAAPARAPEFAVEPRQEPARRETFREPASPMEPPRRAAAAPPPRSDPAASLSVLGNPALRESRHGTLRAGAANQLQRHLGNAAVQRLLAGDTVAQARDGSGAAPPAVADYVERSRGQGQALDRTLREPLGSGLGHDLGGVRLHTDTGAGDAARALGAQAFTSGRDLYFGHGRYQPETGEGRHLLAHELAHTVQQGAAPPAVKRKLIVGSPDDPLEREADATAERLVRGAVAEQPGAEAGGGIDTVRRANEAPAPPGPAPAPEGEAGAGDLEIKLGTGILIKAAELSGRGRGGGIDLTAKPPTVPGLKLKRFLYRPASKTGELEADLNVPFVQGAPAGVKVAVDATGKAEFKGRAKLPVKIGALNEPTLDLTVGSDQQVTATLAVSADKLKPPGLSELSVEGGGQITLGQGKLSGSVKANLVYAGLAKGDFHLGFKDGVPEGGGQVEITQEFLAGASAGLKVEQGNLTADVTVPAAKIAPPIPGLSVPDGSIQIIMSNGLLSGAITGLRLVYRELGEATLGGRISKGQVEGTGELLVNIPAIEPVKGKLGYKSGKLRGEATVAAKQFPASLPVKSGSITAGIDEKGDVRFRGEVGVEFASVGRGTLRGAYDKGKLDLGADVTVSVPGLDPVTARIDYRNGELEGEVDVPVASKKLAGITGNLHVEYRNKLWKGESKLGYERDNGKVKGDVTLGLAQTEKGDLAVYGGGTVTARLTDFLAGTLKVDILPEGETKLHGAITVTEPIQLFPEKKADKELFSVSRNIPLWAILVAVIRLRAGVRAGIGPGQLRDITVEGEYTVGAENLPSFEISGELFIPAYAEAYVAFGAGLGLDVVLGSLTGGIEAIGTAGLYGAISVLPVISYRDGNYNINGTATMAAAAKLKLGLQAWAEVEALWITVWEKTWRLGEWVWDVGPTLALQANVNYTFGQPEPPSFEFKTSDIDAERLIQDAMPKEGPKGSGAREALKNRAEWSGALKGKGKEADKAPEEATDKAKAPETPAAPPKPAKKAPPAPGEAPPKGAVKEEGGKKTPELEKAIQDAAKTKHDSKAVREQAAVILTTRLGSGRPLGETSQIVGEVLQELRPTGLERLEVGEANESGERPILAAASTLEELLLLAPELSGRDTVRVSMATRIKMAGERPAAEGAERLTSFAPHPRIGGRGVSQPTVIPIGQERPEMSVLEPTAEEPATLEIVSWNTAVNLNRQNLLTRESHAETQFVTWLDNEGGSFRSRIREIDILLSDSPCDLCCEQLRGILQGLNTNRLPADRVTGKIRWNEPYPGTTNRGISNLRAAPWVGTYGPVPAGVSIQEPSDSKLPLKPIRRKR